MKLYEGIREVASGRTNVVRCPNCGEMNPAEDETCFNCNATLIKPQSMWRNVAEVFYSPLTAMRRIALTRPLMQGLLLGFLFAFITTLEQIYFRLSIVQDLQNNISKITEAQRTAILSPNVSVYSDALPFSIVLSELISFVVAPLIIFLLARLIFRDQAKPDIKGLLSVAGFAQLSNLITMLAYLYLFFVPGALDIPAYVEIVRQLTWAVLMAFGVKFSTTLPWARAVLLTAIVMLLPQLLTALAPR